MAGRRDGAVATRRLPLRVSRLPTPYFRIRGSHCPNQASGRLVAYSAGLFDFNGFYVYILRVYWIDYIGTYGDLCVCVLILREIEEISGNPFGI